MKYIVIIALILIGVIAGAVIASAAQFADNFPRAEVFGVIEGKKDDSPIYKVKDGATTCYIVENPKGLLAMSCVK